MSDVTIASSFARRLVDLEARRSSQPQKAAIRTVANRLHHPPGTLWSLLFRAPKTVSTALFGALEAAVLREIRREIGALENELASLTRSRDHIDPGTIAEVEEGLARLKSSLNGKLI